MWGVEKSCLERFFFAFEIERKIDKTPLTSSSILVLSRLQEPRNKIRLITKCKSITSCFTFPTFDAFCLRSSVYYYEFDFSSIQLKYQHLTLNFVRCVNGLATCYEITFSKKSLLMCVSLIQFPYEIHFILCKCLLLFFNQKTKHLDQRLIKFVVELFCFESKYFLNFLFCTAEVLPKACCNNNS